MMVQLEITRYVHDADTSNQLREEPDSCTLQFSEQLPSAGDRIRTEEGRTFRVTSRIWLPGGLLLRCEERVLEERAA